MSLAQSVALSPEADAVPRVEGKKILTDEANLIAEGIKAVKVFADTLATAKKGVDTEVSFTDAQGAQHSYKVTPAMYRDFVKQLSARIKKMPSLAMNVNKTRRRAGPNAGFLAPAKFDDEIVSFFAQAELGPVVTGDLKLEKPGSRKIVPDAESLRALPNSALQDRLYFIQPQIAGGANPLYGIASSGVVNPMFSLHIHYGINPLTGQPGLQTYKYNWNTGRPITNAQGQPEIGAGRMTSSNLMRQTLRNTMIKAIENDARVLSAEYPAVVQQFNDAVQPLIDAIDDPNLFVVSRFATGTTDPRTGNEKIVEMFNPNYFSYAHVSKLISNGKVKGFGKSEIADLRQSISQAYQPVLNRALNEWSSLAGRGDDVAVDRMALMQDAMENAVEQGVLTYQQDDVAKASAFKKAITNAERRKAKERK